MITTIINEKEQIKTEELIRVFINTLDVNDKPHVQYPEGNSGDMRGLTKFINNLPVDTEAIIVINLDKINFTVTEESYRECIKTLSGMVDSKEKIILFKSISLPADTGELSYINYYNGTSFLYISSYIWRLHVIEDRLVLLNLKSITDELYNKEIEVIISEEDTFGYYYKYDDVYQNIKKYMFE